MKETRTIYLLFLSTGTLLSKAIDLYTKTNLNHVSIAFDKELSEVYSFGRKRPYNPFIGGFVREAVTEPFFNQSMCAVYELEISNDQYLALRQHLQMIESMQHLYRYNFIGLFGFFINYEVKRTHAYFCSQFVATMLQAIDLYPKDKQAGLTRPDDLRQWDKLELVYIGTLQEYLQLPDKRRKFRLPIRSFFRMS
ncbi:MAG: hypothetical protein ACQER2_02220 [Bacillota bacterium]